MDEKKMIDILSKIDAPPPQKSVQKQAIDGAIVAFDQKIQKRSQGFSIQGRLTDVTNGFNNIRRKIMQKRYIVSGMTGAVALGALVAVLGPGFYTQRMEGIVPASTSDISFIDSTANVVSVTNLGLLSPKKEILAHKPAENKDKIRQEADAMRMPMMAAEVGASTMMVAPITMSDELSQPQYKDVGRDKFEDFEENAIKSVKEEPVSTFSIDVDTASYGFVRRQLNSGVLPQKDAVRVEEMINYFDYSYAVPEAGGHPFQPTVAVYASPWKEGNKIVHIGIKGFEIEAKPKSNLVFLLDTSGSMNSPDKLPLLVNSFKLMLDGLQAEDTVAIVTYAGSAGTALEPTKVSDKHRIIAALENLHAGGSTAGAEGIRQAYHLAEQSFIKEGNNRVILATDGDFNVGITNPEELQDFVERQRDKGLYLSVLGFGQGNYNDHMMQTLAQNGNGNAAYIDTLSEARKVLVEEAGSTLFTIAKDVKIQVEFNPASVQEYRLIGYETRHLNREDFNNDKVDAGEIGAGHSVTAIYEVTPAGVQPMVDDLRFAQKREKAMEPQPAQSELAFLKIRYKKPESTTSVLMEQPIRLSDEKPFAAQTDDIRFASAVAGFGQLLKGGKFTGSLTYDQVIDIANNARGIDPFGYRTEFVNLVRLAKTAANLPSPQQ